MNKQAGHRGERTMEKAKKRQEKFHKQRAERGWDDSECWSLNSTIAEFLAPRLRRFAETTCSYPPGLAFEQWKAIVLEMADGFDELAKDVPLERDYKKATRALVLFRKWFGDLWQ